MSHHWTKDPREAIADRDEQIKSLKARIAELEESVTRRDRLPADLSQQDAVAISGFQDFLAVNAKNEQLAARIAELESRPDPPAPIATGIALKPCPFCGSIAKAPVMGRGEDEFTIVCWSCELDGPAAKTADLAALAWNNRPDPPTPAAIDPDDRRCAATGNPCGTDTVMQGHPCLCGPCIRDAKRRLAIEPDMPRRFRFHKCAIIGFGQKFGLYIPSSGRVIAEDGSRFVGMPNESDFEGFEWIDAAPKAKEGDS